MEMTLKNEMFQGLTVEEMDVIIGGGALEIAQAVFGAAAITWAAPVAFVCPPAGLGMVLGGLGLIGKGTGLY